MLLPSGSTFQRYLVESLLGHGGMGEVYLASDPRLQRKVALKILRRSDADPEAWETSVARIEREARAAAALNHPCTVAIYDVGEHEGVPYIVMELIEGVSLRAHASTSPSIDERLRILKEVARALAAAHRAGLVHRDVKPDNVMIRSDGAVKVLDFGIARRVRFEQTGAPAGLPSREITAPGVLVGTPAYMSPEQISGDEIEPRTDQFAWGVLAFELLAGRLPFQSDKGAMGMFASILRDPPPPLPDTLKQVEPIVHRALSKHPRDRYPSMDALLDDLTQAAPQSENQPALLKRLQPSEEALSAGMATTQVAVVPGRQELLDSGGQKPAAPVSEPKRRALWAIGAAALLALGLSAMWLRPHEAPPAPDAAPSATGTARTAPTTLTSLPVPPIENREALLAYREGMQALRDGAWEPAQAAFEKARTLEAGFTLAHLRFALATSPSDRESSRKAFQKAVLQRTQLGERDQGLLDAFDPYIRRDPPEAEETLKRLQALSERFPGDAEIRFWQANLESERHRPESALPHAEACLALDPKYADCWQSKAIALIDTDRRDEATVALDRCMESSIAAVDCVAERGLLDSSNGKCEHLADMSRRWISLSPTSGRPHYQLATALLSLGRPRPVVEAAVDQAVKKGRKSGENLTADIVDAELSMALGDFKVAEQRLVSLGEQLDSATALAWRADVTAYLSLLYEEVDNLPLAGKAAMGVLTRKEATGQRDTVPWQDRTPVLRAIAVRAGLLDRPAYTAARKQWLGRFEGEPAATRLAAWYVGYAMPARTAEDAKEALDALPALAPLPHKLPKNEYVDGHHLLGRVYFLAGDMAAAQPHLAAGSGCHALLQPLGYVQNIFRLGVAEQALGHPEAACEAYQTVVSRWDPKGPSLTARAAAERIKALSCNKAHKPSSNP